MLTAESKEINEVQGKTKQAMFVKWGGVRSFFPSLWLHLRSFVEYGAGAKWTSSDRTEVDQQCEIEIMFRSMCQHRAHSWA